MEAPSLPRLEYALLLLLTLLLAIATAAPSHSVNQSAVTGAGLVAGVALVLWLHQWRKELTTAYGALVCWALHVVSEASSSQRWLSVGWLGLFLAVLLVWVFPLPILLQPSGPYQTIGCHTGFYAGIECRIFYPSAKSTPLVSASKRLRYLHHGVHLMKGLSVSNKVPFWLFNNLNNAYLSALTDAPVATREKDSNKGWPVVLFSHGLSGSLEMYSNINQQLASEGNIVVVVNHRDGSASVFRSQPEDPSGKHRYEYYHKVSNEVVDDVDGAGFRFRNKQLRQRVEEVTEVLKALEYGQQQVLRGERPADCKDLSLLAAANLSEVTIAGHSFGAATALATAFKLNRRFARVILLDMWMVPIPEEILASGLGDRVPVLHILSEQYVHWEPNFVKQERVHMHCRHPATIVLYLRGSGHNAFSDLPLFAPVLARKMMKVGTVDLRQCLEVTGLVTAAFLRDELDATTIAAVPLVRLVASTAP